MKCRINPLLGVVVVLGLLAGCDRDRERAGTSTTTTVTGANVASLNTDTAVGRLVDARCAREMSCNSVGPDKKYASRDVCTQKMKGDMQMDLNASECPNGIGQEDLDRCVTAIRNESCNNPIEKIERLSACRTSELCMKTAAPTR